MRPQRLCGVELPRQFGLGQRRVDFVMADLMDQDARAFRAALQFRDQVMLRLPDIRRDRAQAERTDRIAHFGRENDIFCPASASAGPVQA